jgi:very-short-patch-repair endonuclease
MRQAEVLGLPLDPAITDGTRSELERLFLRLCRRHRLPEPDVNARIGRFIVDFLWPHERLVVETDGYRYHRGAVAFEEDHARDLELRASGFEVRRFTYRQVSEQAADVAASVRDALARTSRYARGTRPRAS